MAEYEITLKNDSSGAGTASPIANAQTPASTPESAASNSSAGVKSLVVYSKAKAFIKQGIQHQINTVELRTGAAEVQQRLQFGYQIASDVFGIGESIAVGAAVGSVPGAILGAVVGVFGTVVNYANRQNTINMQETREDITISLMDKRAGGSLATYNQSRSRSQ